MRLRSRERNLRTRLVVGLTSFLLPVILCAGTSSGQRDIAPHLVASIQVAPSSGILVAAPITIDASGSSFDIPLDLVDEVRYTWNLGDTTTQVGERIVHAYDLPGTYHVTLTMDVFEISGIYHRATAATVVTVSPAETVPQLVTFDLDASFAVTADSGATALVWPQLATTTQQIGDAAVPGPEVTATGGNAAGALGGLVFSGGVVTLGALTLLDASLGIDILDGSVLLLAGYGLSTNEVTVPLADSFPVVSQSGGEIAAEIHGVTLYSFGIGCRALPSVYLIAEMGLLVVDGIYTGSSRITIDGKKLPVAFSEAMGSFGVGIAFRVGVVVVSAKLLFPM